MSRLTLLAASSKARGMVYSALYRSAVSITNEVVEPVCTKPNPGLAPSPTMTAWQIPYSAVLGRRQQPIEVVTGGEGVARTIVTAGPRNAGAS
jgi:hypothetical protein